MNKNELFILIDERLMSDRKPSVFLDAFMRQPEARQFPLVLLDRLKKTKQSPKHHPEGSVWKHTLLVVDEAAQVCKESQDPRVFMWAALLHVIGKHPATRVSNGRITAYDHDKIGAELALQFLSEFPLEDVFRLSVCALVRYHMHFFYLLRNLPYADIEGMVKSCAVHDIALLGFCDRCGRLHADREEERRNMDVFMKKTREALKIL
jgi:putative nucleotidyltransferase with HDIG domain